MLRRILSTESVGPGGQFRAPAMGGRGRQPGGFGLGLGGECICPECNAKVSHTRGMSCNTLKCPKCGTLMTRAK